MPPNNYAVTTKGKGVGRAYLPVFYRGNGMMIECLGNATGQLEHSVFVSLTGLGIRLLFKGFNLLHQINYLK